jgi:DNA-binding response OmpR family regulator
LSDSNTLAPKYRVLIVDHSEDTRDVLRTALARRGLETLEAPEARQGLRLARDFHPEVIVLDLESEFADDAAIRRQYDQQAACDRASILMLGDDQIGVGEGSTSGFIAKPYHFGPLIRRIEELVENSTRSASA